MNDFMPPLSWDSEEYGIDATPDQLAFAAYEDAWRERDASGRTSHDLLVGALKARTVPAQRYAVGTRLHDVLFSSWDKGRRPSRMHPTILKYRLGKIPHGARTAFHGSMPEDMRRPSDVRRAGKLLGDDTSLPFRPAGTFTARVGHWYHAIDDDDRTREIPIWLDTAARPINTPVMIGQHLAGHVDLPDWAHAQLLGTTKRGRKIVAMGDLVVKRRKDGTYRAKKVEVVLPERKD